MAIQKAHHLQSWRSDHLDVEIIKCNQSLQARGIVYDQLAHVAVRDNAEALESRRVDDHSVEAAAPIQLEHPERGTGGEQGVEGILGDLHFSECEPRQMRECEGRGKVLGETAAAEAGDAEGRREAECARRQQKIVAVRDMDHLEVVEGGRSDPLCQIGDAALAAEVAEAEAAAGASVLGEDLGDAFPGTSGEAGVVEVEWGGAPEGAPPAGEGGGARGVLDREAGDDLGENVVGEEADKVRPFCFRLLGWANRRILHCRRAARRRRVAAGVLGEVQLLGSEESTHFSLSFCECVSGE